MGRTEVDGGILRTSIGGDWDLVDLQGKPFGSKTLKGHYYMVFFGSSLCPDTCPLTLMKMMKFYRQIERQSEG
jgi:protein SCO1/2